ncbi:MAG: tripartite tricarboxylate transporter TctB family protein [Oscillospiraceae bacterium]|nr:tripartite tricarboxylate transporter TctB family protein [Oscillospiraceae bacterium]
MVKLFVKRYRELLVGVFVGLFSAAYLFGSAFIRRSNIVSLGGEFMPELYGYFLLFLSLLQIIIGWKSARASISDVNTSTGESGKASKTDSKNVLMVFIAIVFYLATIQLLGFILSSAIFLFVLNFLLSPSNSKKNPRVTIIYAILLPIITYFIFHNYMNINLPAGIFFN